MDVGLKRRFTWWNVKINSDGNGVGGYSNAGICKGEVLDFYGPS